MRFENTILKLLVRYTKETGKYIAFKKRMCEIFYHYSEKNIIKCLPFNCPLFLPWKINIENNYNDSEFAKYIYSIYKDEIDELFEDFLISNGCDVNFFGNVDYKFIKKFNPNSVKYMSKRDCLFKNRPPYSFILSAFDWSRSAEGYSFWHDIYKMWNICFFDFINSK